MTTPGPRAAKIGDNQPPALDVILKDRHDKLVKKKNAWVKKAEAAVLTPKTEAEILALETLFADGDAIVKEAAKEHTKEKEPFLRDGKVVDTFFNAGIRDKIGVAGGLASRIKQAALSKRLEIAREVQAKAAAEAEKLRLKAEEDEAKGRAAEERGESKLADVHFGRADAKLEDANDAAALATRDIREVSRSVGGGVASSVGEKTVVTGVDKATLDVAALLPFLKEADLIAAAQKVVDMKNPIPKGVFTRVDAVGSIRRRP